jgi:hypothetical protein
VPENDFAAGAAGTVMLEEIGTFRRHVGACVMSGAWLRDLGFGPLRSLPRLSLHLRKRAGVLRRGGSQPPGAEYPSRMNVTEGASTYVVALS